MTGEPYANFPVLYEERGQEISNFQQQLLAETQTPYESATAADDSGE